MSPSSPKEFTLSSAEDVDDVKRALRARLPANAKVAEVQSLSQQQKMECSELIKGVIRCSSPAPSGLAFTRAKWLIEFHFDGDRLKDIKVTKGLIGP